MSTTLLSHVAADGLMEQIAAARRQTDDLFSIVSPDALYDRPIAERHRIVFYIGHLEAFDWNLLHERVFGLQSFHSEFDNLFAFGIDPVGGGLPTDQPSDWPTIGPVRQYVREIRAALDDKISQALESNSDSREADGFSLSTLLHVAFEHRLMHAETLGLHAPPTAARPQDRAEPSPLSLRMRRSSTAALKFPPGKLRWASVAIAEFLAGIMNLKLTPFRFRPSRSTSTK